MPAINIDFLKLLDDNYTNYPCFIETGTNIGNTIFAVEPHFKNLYTIEFLESLYLKVSSKYNSNKIKFLLGDSSKIFINLLPTINESSIFFLDGHYSGLGTGCSEKECPLLEELEAINTHFKPNAIIIIDDARLFGLSAKTSNLLGEDWSDITVDRILRIINDRIEKVYYLNSDIAPKDRMIIHIKKL